MTVTPEELQRLREIGRSRRFRKIEQMRSRLAPYMDTGMMSDDDVRLAHAALTAGEDEPLEEVR